MPAFRVLLAAVALLALQTAGAQGALSRLGTFTWDARNGAVDVQYLDADQHGDGRIIVTLAIAAVTEGKTIDAEQLAKQAARFRQQFAEQFSVWVLADDGSSLPGDNSDFPTGYAPGRMGPVAALGEKFASLSAPFAFKWNRSIALSAVVLRAGDNYHVFAVGTK